jgi:hypothetical protein
VVGDLVITHPQADKLPAAANPKTPGAAAAKAAEDNHKSYEADFVIPKDSFIPLAMETGGRMHPNTRHFLRDFARRRTSLNPDKKAWTQEEKSVYLRTLETLLATVSVALVTAVSRSLQHGMRAATRAGHDPVLKAQAQALVAAQAVNAQGPALPVPAPAGAAAVELIAAAVAAGHGQGPGAAAAPPAAEAQAGAAGPA